VQPNKAPVVEDCGFRMLQPHEIKAAMAFPADYRVLGNKREQVRQLGNAVTPPAMNTLIQRVVQSLAPTVHSANRTDSPRTVEEMKR
jgi:DNA (cytosine-5)-methyltransferase 1